MLKIYVNGHGWVMGIKRDGGKVAGLRFTRMKAGAKPFAGDWMADGDAYDTMYYIENTMKCNYDKVF